MPTTNQQSQESPYNWFTINDFTPGIINNDAFQAPLGAGVNAVPYNQAIGAAQRNLTVNCIALPSGGLVPLPGATSSTAYSLGQNGWTTGAMVLGPVGVANQPTVPEYPNGGDEILIGMESLVGTNGNWTRSWELSMFQEFGYAGSPGSYPLSLMFQSNHSSYNAITATSMVLTGLQQGGGGGTGAAIATIYPYVAVSKHFLGNTGGTDQDANFVLVYPNVTSPTTAPYTYDISNGNMAGTLIAHNNRLVMLTTAPAWNGSLRPYPPGGGTVAGFYGMEWFGFTDPPGSYPFPSQLQDEEFVVEFPFGHGAWGSVTNGELLMIRHQGGGYIISNDLINPSITRLFGLTSTQGRCQQAGQTPAGIVYASQDNGVWLWSGGSVSQKISQQIRDDSTQFSFAQRPTTGPFVPLTTYGPMTNFNNLGDLIYCPVNWVYSTSLNSWWQWNYPTNPGMAPSAWHYPTFDGQGMWVFPQSVGINGLASINCLKLSRLTPANSYTWTSHPISLTNNQMVNIREVAIRAQGTGTITVTFQNITGPTTVTEPTPFTINSASKPVRQRQDAGAMAYDVVIQIVATGASSGPAPMLYDVSLGWQYGNPVSST